MKPTTAAVIADCLHYKGGRSRPDKSAPVILALITWTLARDSDSFLHILDVGCGRGSFGRILKSEFGDRVVVDGIDIHDPYIDRRKMTDYGRVVIGDVRHQDPAFFAPYDVILCVDVLEHLTREDAIDFVSGLLGAGKTVIASIPNGPKHWHQDAGFEAANPHEAHLYNWTDETVQRDLHLRPVASVDGLGVYIDGGKALLQRGRP